MLIYPLCSNLLFGMPASVNRNLTSMWRNKKRNWPEEKKGSPVWFNWEPAILHWNKKKTSLHTQASVPFLPRGDGLFDQRAEEPSVNDNNLLSWPNKVPLVSQSAGYFYVMCVRNNFMLGNISHAHYMQTLLENWESCLKLCEDGLLLGNILQGVATLTTGRLVSP
jgi:hypothetical protein